MTRNLFSTRLTSIRGLFVFVWLGLYSLGYASPGLDGDEGSEAQHPPLGRPRSITVTSRNHYLPDGQRGDEGSETQRPPLGRPRSITVTSRNHYQPDEQRQETRAPVPTDAETKMSSLLKSLENMHTIEELFSMHTRINALYAHLEQTQPGKLGVHLKQEITNYLYQRYQYTEAIGRTNALLDLDFFTDLTLSAIERVRTWEEFSQYGPMIDRILRTGRQRGNFNAHEAYIIVKLSGKLYTLKEYDKVIQNLMHLLKQVLLVKQVVLDTNEDESTQTEQNVELKIAAFLLLSHAHRQLEHPKGDVFYQDHATRLSLENPNYDIPTLQALLGIPVSDEETNVLPLTTWMPYPRARSDRHIQKLAALKHAVLAAAAERSLHSNS